MKIVNIYIVYEETKLTGNLKNLRNNTTLNTLMSMLII